MAEFLGTAAPSQLLILMAFPLTGAALLIGFLVFFYVRRNQKPQMKHGVVLTDETADPVASEPTAVASTVPAAPPPQNKKPAAEALGLKLDLLNKNITPEQPKLNSATAAVPQQAKTNEPVELARLLRDPHSGQLIVDVGGQRYAKLADVTDKKMGQFILKLAAHLLAFTNGMTISEAGVKTTPAPKVGPAPEPILVPITDLAKSVAATPATPETSEPVIPKPPPEAEAAFLASLQAKKVEPDPEPATGRGLFGRTTTAPIPTLIPALNLAKEINTIVQARLIYSPLAETTKVDVISAFDGGIRINVNGTFYETPDDIPDPAVKALIKESIKQWERS